MHLDLRTIFISYSLCNCAIILVILPLWLSNRNRFRGINFWVIDFIFQILGNVFYVLHGQMPDAAAIILRNAMFVTGNMFLVTGLLQFYDIKPAWKYHYGLVTVFVISIGYFTLFDNQLNIRVILFSIALGTQMIQIIILIHTRIDKNFRMVAWPLSVTASLTVVVLGIRFVQTLRHPIHGEFFSASQVFFGYWLLAMQIISILLIISLFYVVTSRLALELRTYQEELEKRVVERTYQLLESEKFAVIGRLAGGIAHEVNNPNQVIALNLPHVRRGIKALQKIADPKRYETETVGGNSLDEHLKQLTSAIDDMEIASDRIGRIARDLKQHVSPQEKECVIDLSEVIATSFNLTKKYREKHTDKTECKLEKGKIYVKGYIHRLEQVVINILNNAAESLPDRDKAIYIETTSYSETAIVRITDEGRGINPQDLPLVTSPFFTTRRQDGGTGLGLWVALQIIKDHHGSMNIQSAVGKGTTVSIALPLYKEQIS